MSEGIPQEFLLFFIHTDLCSAQIPEKGSLAWDVTEEGKHLCCPCVWLLSATPRWHYFFSTTQSHEESTELGPQVACLLDRLAFPQVKGPFLCDSTNLLSDPAGLTLDLEVGECLVTLWHCAEELVSRLRNGPMWGGGGSKHPNCLGEEYVT